MRFVKLLLLLLLAAAIACCGNTMDDLNPSGSDKRPEVQEGSTGPAVTQKAPDFTLYDSQGNSVTLASALASSQGLVLYFTMWCPICDTHMSHMRSDIVPLYPNVRFYIVDYVSGSVADARSAELSSGYGPPFTVLSDSKQALLNSYNATMGTTVVIDAAGLIRLNEDYKDGARLASVLKDQP